MARNSQRKQSAGNMRFDNFPLKEWLYSVGRARRCDVLKKLKMDIQYRGLSPQIVHRCLVQLMTKPRVILTRLPSCDKYGSKRPLEKNEEDEHNSNEKILITENSVHTNVEIEDKKEPNDNNKVNEKKNNISQTLEETVKKLNDNKNSREINKIFDTSGRYSTFESNSSDALLCSFDKALKQLDELISVSKNTQNRESVTVVAADSTCKMNNANLTNTNNTLKNIDNITVKKNVDILSKRTIFDRDDGAVNKCNENDRNDNRLFSNSTLQKKDKSWSLKSKSHKKVNSHFPKSHDKKTIPDKKKVYVTTSIQKSSETENNVNQVTSTQTEDHCLKHVRTHKRKQEATCNDSTKPRKRICSFVKEKEELDRRNIKRLKWKFRACFGDCTTYSEDEQEQVILNERYKKRRKKDSIDSCDSGVCDNEVHISSSGTKEITSVCKIPEIVIDNAQCIDKDINSVNVANNCLQNDICNEEPLKQIQVLKKTVNTSDVSTLEDVSVQEINIEEECTVTKLQMDVKTEGEYDLGKEVKDQQQNEVKLQPESKEATVKLQPKIRDEITMKTGSELNEGSLMEAHGVLKEETTEEAQPIKEKKPKTFLQPEGINSSTEIKAQPEQVTIVNPDVEIVEVKLKSDSTLGNGAKSVLKPKTTLKIDLEGMSDLTVCNSNINENSSTYENNNQITTNVCLDTNDNKVNNDNKVHPVTINEEVRVDIEQNSHTNVDENGNIKLPALEGQNVMRETSTNKELYLNDRRLISGINPNTDIISNNNNDLNKTVSATQDVHPNSTTEQKDNRTNEVPQTRLRVLSGAELGSRWCPTPVNSEAITNSHTSSTTSTAPASNRTKPTVISSKVLQQNRVFIKKPATTAATHDKQSTESKHVQFAKAVLVTFVKIGKLICSARVHFRNTNSDYDKLLFAEFDRLKTLSNAPNYVILTPVTVHILNTQFSLNVSRDELFYYAPSFKALCDPTMYKCNICVNNLNRRQASAYCHEHDLGSPIATSLLKKLEELVTLVRKQYRYNLSSTQLQQNSIEKIVQPQHGSQMNNAAQSSKAADFRNLQYQNYNHPLQRNTVQQAPPNACVQNQNLPPKMYGAQPPPYSRLPNAGFNPTDDRYIPLPVANAAFTQYLPQDNSQPRTNTFCNVDIQNYPVHRQVNPTMTMVPDVSPLNITPAYQNMLGQLNSNMPKANTIQSNSHAFLNNNSLRTKVHCVGSNSVRQNQPVPQENFSQNIKHKHLVQQVAPSQHKQNVSTRVMNQEKPFSLRSMRNLFDVLKHISDIQKFTLLKQLDFYFCCTGWLDQKYTANEWKNIDAERCLLLNLQTVLKHVIENLVKDMIAKESEGNLLDTNILQNVTNNVVKTMRVLVPESDVVIPINDKVTNDEASRKNVNENCSSGQENNNGTVVEDKSNDQQPQLQNETRSQENIQTEEITQLEKDPSHTVVPIIKAEKKQKDISEEKTNNCQNMHNVMEKKISSVSDHVQSKPSAITDLKSTKQDSLQQTSSHLVIVEVSSNSNQIMVVDTDTLNESKTVCHEAVNTTNLKEEEVIVNDVVSPENVSEETDEVYIISEHLPNSLHEDSNISHITDIKSISLETFQDIKSVSDTVSHPTEDSIEEEEVKVCLLCGKPSTVACAVCLEAKYCSTICSTKHWWEQHYQDCTSVNTVYL